MGGPELHSHETEPDRVRRHRSYRRATRRADSLKDDPDKLIDLVSRAMDRAKNVMPERFQKIQGKLPTVGRMVKAYAKGEYTDVPWGTIGLIVTSLIYFITPIDLIPDVIPVLGFSDDVALFAWTISQIRGDIERFSKWEEENQLNPSS